MKICPKYASPKAQNLRLFDSLEHNLIEIVKNGSKIFTEPDLKKKGKQFLPQMIYAYALDNILVAMKGKRIFERFGFNLPQQHAKKGTSKFVTNYENWLFSNSSNDWINENTGECLTGYMQTIELSYLLNECINTIDC